MHKLYKLLILLFCLSGHWALAQADSSKVTSIDADLLNIFNQKLPQKYKVAKVKVTGNQFFDETLLVSIAGINVGDEIAIPGGDDFSRAITKLWSQNYFSDVVIYITRLHNKEIDIEINVTERPRLSKFNFKNIKKSEVDELTPKTGLVVGRVITENMKITAIDAIKKYYSEKGFRGVAVSTAEQKDESSDNYLVLNFDIVKGRKVKINNINFIGNTIDVQKLKSQMKSTKEMMRLTLFPPKDSGAYATQRPYTFNQYAKEKGYLTYTKTRKILDPYIRLKLSSSKYDDKKFEEDKKELIQYYNSLGYRDAAIISDTSYYNDNGDLNVGIKLLEGNKYYFGNITWKGNTKYSDSILSLILNIKKGNIYNANLLHQRIGHVSSPEGGDIGSLYMDDGYLFFNVVPTEISVYNDTIDHEIRIQEGAQATYKNITITGNDKTKDFVVLRELRTIPGDKFNRSDLMRSQREIASLGFFNQEKVNPVPVSNPEDGTVNVNWELEEKSSDQLELSAGFGGGIGLTGTLGVSFNNFSVKNIFNKKSWDPLPTGDGQKLSLRVQSNGRAYRSYNASFTEPWFGGKKKNSFSLSFYDTKYANAYDPLKREYSKSAADTSFFKTTGVSIGLGKQLTWPDDYFNVGLTLSYARYKLKNYYIDRINLPGFNNGNSHNLNLKLSFQRNSVFDPIFPRSGSNYLASLQVTPPYSLFNPNRANKTNPYEWIEYYKWRFTGEWYVPLSEGRGENRNRQFVLKASAKYGFIGRYNNKLEVSPFERFQVGDAGLSNTYALLGYDIISHRGYPVYQLSNPSINPDQSGATEYFTIFNKYTLELRYPISLNPSSTIYGLTFFEAANGWYSLKEYNPFKLRRSVGVGMRFFLPMFGLLGFDYGVGLDRITSPGVKLKDAAKFTFMLGFEPE